jgi:hypothetical protein
MMVRSRSWTSSQASAWLLRGVMPNRLSWVSASASRSGSLTGVSPRLAARKAAMSRAEE